jgi:hypothetical protein
MSFQLGSKTEQLADEESLADHIPFCHPSHSTLPDHVHCFDSLQSPPRALEGTIALGQPNSFLYCSVLLFDYIVEICIGVEQHGGEGHLRLSMLPPQPDTPGSFPRSSPAASRCPTLR